MKNNLLSKRLIICVLSVLILFVFSMFMISCYEHDNYIKVSNYKINTLVGLVKNKYPEVSDKEILNILETSEDKNSYFKQYGFDIESDSLINDLDSLNKKYMIIKMVTILIFIFVIFFTIVIYNKKHNNRIDDLIESLKKIDKVNYELDLEDSVEDKLSLLKQDLYKLSIMLKESSINSLNDKLVLKESLQDISHQLKTPITSINIMLDNMINDDDMDIKTRNKFVKQIKREISNMSFLIQNILKLSKFEANVIEFKSRKVTVSELIKDSIHNVDNLRDLKDVNIISNLVDCSVCVDKRWQVEAVTNILKNALDYSDVGSEIVIDVEDNKVYTSISITDNGRGMSEEDTINIFKRFYKGKNSNSDSVGIGLALSKAIVERENGIISVMSELGKGTSFIIKYFK